MKIRIYKASFIILFVYVASYSLIRYLSIATSGNSTANQGKVTRLFGLWKWDIEVVMGIERDFDLKKGMMKRREILKYVYAPLIYVDNLLCGSITK